MEHDDGQVRSDGHFEPFKQTNIPSLEQDKRIRGLETSVLELMHEITETRRQVHVLRQQTVRNHIQGPMCILVEGHKGECKFE